MASRRVKPFFVSVTPTPPKAAPVSRAKKNKNKGPALKNPLQLVTLYAGSKSDSKSVVVHKDFACHYSPVFKAAFNSGFVEGQTQEYRVDEEDEEVIRLLVHWFYTQQLDILQTPEDSQGDKSEVAGKEELCLAKLWVLADKLIIPQLQNMTLDVLAKLRLKSKAGIASKCLEFVCANTSKNSGLRRWFVHRCAFRLESSSFLEHPERWRQLSERMFTMKSTPHICL
ncbi:hypothetical protein N431DRAFT_490688 [Stipitochalara longipes BDJ]|nr:hypothetical protein N431DRAFT_490688 [Stipitochalara longipes BDJ]